MGTWTFCLVQQIHFAFLIWTKGRGFICVNICYISTYGCPSKPRISRSLPQKWVLQHSARYIEFISLLWHELRAVDSSLMTFLTFQHSLDLQTKDFKVTIPQKRVLEQFCLVQQIHFTSLTWSKGRKFICANICSICAYTSPSKPRILKSLPQKWVLEHSSWYNKFISLLLHELRAENSFVLTFATFPHTRVLQNQEFRSHCLGFYGHRYDQMLRMLSEINILSWVYVADVKWIFSS